MAPILEPRVVLQKLSTLPVESLRLKSRSTTSWLMEERFEEIATLTPSTVA